MNKKNVTRAAIPIQMTADDDMLPEYEIDYAKAKPNRFAGKKHVVVGAVSDNYEKMKHKRSGRKATSNGAPARQTVVAKRVYLYPHQIKTLARIDKNFSAAIRKLVDAHQARAAR